MCQPDARWTKGPERPSLPPRSVHVWRLSLEANAGTQARLMGWLSDDERARAARFRFDHHRRRFVVGRARVRQLLGRYTGLSPEALVFEYGPRGKPRLRGTSQEGAVRFNFSNSFERGLLAVASTAEVGVDLEYIKPLPRFLALADRFFTAREAAALRRVPETSRLHAFFRIWTLKEAFLKATGEGLHGELKRVEVSTEPRGPVCLHAVDGDPAAAARWFVRVLEPGDGYTGALVVDGPVERVEWWSFE